ncbi:MAG: hypothetical protein EA422_13625 [Gemmatimonadales bacterium]|nr:MAG: hypothetical protein EA422_13625 [Gemmatimonadales bacterium]
MNCLQDMHGTECQIDQYELCEEEPTEDQLLVVLPGSPGVTAVTAHLGLRTTCRSRSDTSSDVFAIALY